MNGQNKLSEKTGKLAISPRKRRDLEARRELAGGKKAAPGSEQPPRDAAAYVRALLGR